MLNCHDIADYFIAQVDEESGDNITNLKLQKLVYYAQGFHLALFGRPLFEEPILAWEHGPVVPELYQRFRGHGSNAIPAAGVEVDFAKYPQETRELLDEVSKVFGQYSAWKLREMTHDEPPWRDTSQNAAISHLALRDYFATRLTNGKV